MRELFEGWRSHLTESPELRLYCDMDGVLVDFQAGVLAYMNDVLRDMGARKDELSQLKASRSNPEYLTFKAASQAAEELGGWGKTVVAKHINRPDDGGYGLKQVRNFMYRLVEDDREFWANLPWMDGGKELWDYIKEFNVEILSAPMGPNSILGKQDWVARELGDIPTNITDDKSPYGKVDGQQGVLVDDRAKYRAQFESGGGIAIEHTPGFAPPSIEGLKKLGFIKGEEDDAEEVEA
jgi:hypothetical protein